MAKDTVKINERDNLGTREATPAEIDQTIGHDVEIFLKADAVYYPAMLSAFAGAVYDAAHVDIANFNHLNKLATAASGPSKAALGKYLQRVRENAEFGFKSETESGRETRISFFRYAKDEPSPFSLRKSEVEMISGEVLKVRKAITNAGLTGLRLIGLGDGQRELNRGANDFNVAEKAAAFLARMAKEGYVSEAVSLARTLAADKIFVDEAKIKAAANSIAEQEKRAIKTLNAVQARKARFETAREKQAAN